MTDASAQLMLIADLGDVLRSDRALAPGYSSRSLREDDRDAVSVLYYAAYPPPRTPDLESARVEIAVSYTGEYGVLDLGASSVIEHDGLVIAAVMTVFEAPWPGSPPGPFVIEVMTEPAHRRLGLAEHALVTSAKVLNSRGAPTMALFVVSDNAGARALYEKLGFRPWEP